MHHITLPGDIAEDFAETFDDPYLPDDIGTRLSCAEVDVLAALLRALGYADAAERWIISHSAADDEGDAHYVQRLYYHE